MKRDKIKVYILESMLCIIFFFTLFVSSTYLRTITAVLLVLSFLLVRKIVLKRNIISLHYKQVTILMGLLSVVFLLIYYLLGFYFGYVKSLVTFNLWTLLLMIIPTSVIIIVSEIIRSIFMSEKSIISKILTTTFLILIDLTLYTTINQLTTFKGFVDVIGFSLLASIANNLLWNYTSVRFGYRPSIIFRLIITLYEFIIPVVPNVFMYFRCFLRIVYPYIIYLILEVLYAKKDFIVSAKDKKRDNIISAILLIMMILMIMLISCEFKYGLLVIGTGSMAGTIDIGDVVVYERYDNQNVKEQQIIIFERDEIRVVHRVVDIKDVNGVRRYYTKGDANKQNDSGYLTQDDIFGVVKFKVKYIGYPTLILRDFF